MLGPVLNIGPDNPAVPSSPRTYVLQYRALTSWKAQLPAFHAPPTAGPHAGFARIVGGALQGDAALLGKNSAESDVGF